MEVHVKLRSHRSLATMVTATTVLLGCASAPLDAEWKSPQATEPIRPVRLLVACDARETALARLCADELQRAFDTRGIATVATASDTTSMASAARDSALAAEARRAGAGAVWVATVRPDAADAERRGGVSIGIGGFSMGRGGSGVGVGVSAPLDLGGRSPPRYAADARLVDPADARLRWTASAGSRSSGDAAEQLRSLVDRLVEGGLRAGVY